MSDFFGPPKRSYSSVRWEEHLRHFFFFFFLTWTWGSLFPFPRGSLSFPSSSDLVLGMDTFTLHIQYLSPIYTAFLYLLLVMPLSVSF